MYSRAEKPSKFVICVYYVYAMLIINSLFTLFGNVWISRKEKLTGLKISYYLTITRNFVVKSVCSEFNFHNSYQWELLSGSTCIDIILSYNILTRIFYNCTRCVTEMENRKSMKLKLSYYIIYCMERLRSKYRGTLLLHYLRVKSLR